MRYSHKLSSLMVGLLIACLLAACSASTPATEAPTSAPAPTAAPAPTTAPEPTAAPEATAASEPTAAPEPTAEPAASANGDCEAGFRYVEHEVIVGGSACVPINPERIIALDMASVELLLMIDHPPVGTANWLLEELPLLLPQYAETLSNIPGLGYPAELEKVASLKPDLILADEASIDVELAAHIAPIVVASPRLYDKWQNGTQLWSEVLDLGDTYAKMEENYNRRIAELQAALGSSVDSTVSIISATTYGVSMWLPNTPPGSILSDVGLKRPQSQSFIGEEAVAEYGADQYISLSMERLDLIDADALFYFTYASTDPSTAESELNFVKDLEQQPVWQSLNVVKNGRSFFVPGYWWRSQTYLLANLVIDDLFTYLTDTKATTPVLSLD
jgi:iron complex transport system substrate-binding protein